MPATTSELTAVAADGVALRIDRVASRGSARGAVVCLHAMMTDGRYFGARRGDDSFAGALAAAGVDVYVADFRGHGRSTPPTARNGTWSFDDLVELDVPAILAACAEASRCRIGDLVVLGHSLGGLAASAAIATGRIPSPKRLVLAAVSVWLGGPLHRRALMSFYRGVTRVVGYAPIRALRAGVADESAAYVDQLTGWARDGRWSSRQGLDYRAALANIRTPTSAYAGARDWMCRPEDAEGIRAPISSAEPLRIIDGADHFTLITRRMLPIADEVR